MAQTTVIISNLDKDNFVASENSRVSLANKIKAALTDGKLYESESHTLNVIAHWSELPFLNRIIAIFEREADASQAYQYLLKSQSGQAVSTANTEFLLPTLARVFLQENLLQRSKLSEALTQDHAVKTGAQTVETGPRDSGDLAGYCEPAPKPIDMYTDLLNAGIDISKFNTTEQVNEVRGRPQGYPQLSRKPTLTKTLFKPSLRIDTNSTGAGEPSPLSPTITLDQM